MFLPHAHRDIHQNRRANNDHISRRAQQQREARACRKNAQQWRAHLVANLGQQLVAPHLHRRLMAALACLRAGQPIF